MARLTRLRAVAPATVVALLALSACSGKDGGDTAAADTAASGSEGSDADAQALVFAECMRDNGVDMPDPGPGQQGLADAFQAIADGVDQDAIRRAMAACEELMPQYASEDMHDEDTMLDLAECLRDQGLDVSDDPFAEVHGGEIDVEEFSAAMEVCRDVLTRGDR